MEYESDPLPYYLGLSNCSYYIMLNDVKSPSTPPAHLSRHVPTIPPSEFSLTSAPPWCRIHRWFGRPPFMIFSLSVSWCNFLWVEVPWHPFPPPPGVILTLFPPHVYPSSLWYALPSGDVNPPTPLASSQSPPIYHWRIISLTVPTPYTSPTCPAPLLSSSPSPLQ